MKKVVFYFVLLLLIPLKVNANMKPVLDGNVVYANGYAITIKERNDNIKGAIISFDGGQFLVDESAIIFGGGKASESYTGSNITMIGGTISTIYGGGNGTEEYSSNVGTSQITIDGGKVNNAIYGGGRLASTVTTSNIRMVSGTVNNVLGGGGASSGSFSVGTYDTMGESLNHTISANISVVGGTITSALFGGGQGYSHVDDANISVGGNAEIIYIVGGGSNGQTDKVTMNLNGGFIEVVQGVNRGIIGDINLNIKGAHINNLYALGDSNDASVTGKIKSDSKEYINIISGQINNLYTGVNDGKEVSDTSNIYITYKEGTVNNLEGNFKNIEKIKASSSKLDDVPKTGINYQIPVTQVIASIILGIIIRFKIFK